MANIFKTTLKKDVIADIVNNGKREVRFPITKYWATRFSDEYNLNEKSFIFKTFDSLEFSSPSNFSPSNKESGETYVFDFIGIFVDGEEFVVEFKDNGDDSDEDCVKDIQSVDVNDIVEDTNVVVSELNETPSVVDIVVNDDDSDVITETIVETKLDSEMSFENTIENDIDDVNETTGDTISNEDVFDMLTQWLEDEKHLDNYYADDNIFATNARQIIVLPKGKVLGFKKTLPVNNDAEVRIEFDSNEKIYFDSTIVNFNMFEDEVLKTLNEIRKNNFVFIWKRHTGIFMDSNGVYFGIKYSTRKSIGFNRKYNVQ